MRFRFRYALTGLAGVLLLAAAGSVFRAHDALGIEESTLAALESDSEVLVSQDEFTVFQPAEGIPGTGLIFYPGGRVDYRSYAPALRDIASHGYLVVLIPALLNCMVFDPNAAEAVFPEFPQIAYWPVGGHSLGGAMAADFLYTHPDAAAGLVLWASYPASSNDLSDSGLLRVLSVYEMLDMAGQEPFDSSRGLLPADTTWIVISGGNLAQFGDYGLQPGGHQATISPADRQAQVVDHNEVHAEPGEVACRCGENVS